VKNLEVKSLGNWLKTAAHLIAGFGLVVAMMPSASAGGGNVPQPTIQKAKGEQCVEDTEYMRRNHMKVLTHQRDKTMREGIRTKQHSLKNCIECHATPNEKGERSVLGKDNFCQSCHSYAAVQVDCFQCHSSKPAGNAAMHPIVPAQSATGQPVVGAQTAASLRHHAGAQPPNLGSGVSAKVLTGVAK
jgi:hypothetical protein